MDVWAISEGEKKILKELLLIVFSKVLQCRRILSRSAFRKQKFYGSKIVVLDRNALLVANEKTMVLSLLGAFETIDADYLHSLTLVVREYNETNKALETFTIYFHDNNYVEMKGDGMSKFIRVDRWTASSISSVLDEVRVLSDHLVCVQVNTLIDPLVALPEAIQGSFRIGYNNNAPKGFQARYYERATSPVQFKQSEIVRRLRSVLDDGKKRVMVMEVKSMFFKEEMGKLDDESDDSDGDDDGPETKRTRIAVSAHPQYSKYSAPLSTSTPKSRMAKRVFPLIDSFSSREQTPPLMTDDFPYETNRPSPNPRSARRTLNENVEEVETPREPFPHLAASIENVVEEMLVEEEPAEGDEDARENEGEREPEKDRDAVERHEDDTIRPENSANSGSRHTYDSSTVSARKVGIKDLMGHESTVLQPSPTTSVIARRESDPVLEEEKEREEERGRDGEQGEDGKGHGGDPRRERRRTIYTPTEKMQEPERTRSNEESDRRSTLTGEEVVRREVDQNLEEEEEESEYDEDEEFVMDEEGSEDEF